MAGKIFKRKVPVTIYSTHANLCVVKTMEDMQQYLDKKVKGMVDVLGADGCVFEMFTKEGLEYFIVFVEDKLSHNLVAHEVYHLGSKIASDINITDEESIAWLVGYLTENVYKILEAKNYKIDK